MVMADSSGIASALRNCKTVLISVHKSPDGDALGSQLALTLALEKLEKSVTMQNLDPVPEIYRFLPASDRILTGSSVEGRFDAVMVLDSDPQRTGIFNKGFPAGLLINIDHHITNSREWNLTWLDSTAAATGEMIYRLIQEIGVPIDPAIALCIYTSIFTDTGSFRYSNTTAESMHIAAEMIEAGADPWLVTENVYESFAFRRLKLLGEVISGMERSEDGRIAWAVVTHELFKKSGTSAEDTDNFVNYVRAVKGVEVGILFRQTGERQYKISLRSKGRVDVSGVAGLLGGGGHRNAAGATLDGSQIEVKNRVVSEVEKAVHLQSGSGDLVQHGRHS
jgi:phosphoesterase RecJ-like protein